MNYQVPQSMPQAHEKYRHYKGGTYVVLAISQHTETKEIMVTYMSLEHATIWSRPLKVWNEIIPHPQDPDKSICRFYKIARI